MVGRHTCSRLPISAKQGVPMGNKGLGTFARTAFFAAVLLLTALLYVIVWRLVGLRLTHQLADLIGSWIGTWRPVRAWLWPAPPARAGAGRSPFLTGRKRCSASESYGNAWPEVMWWKRSALPTS